MASFRPAVKESDGYVQKISKYIPVEIIAGYTALTGYLTIGANMEIPSHYKTYYIILLIVLIVMTPVWTYFAVIDGQAAELDKQKKRVFFQAAIAMLSFIIWVYAIGNVLLKAILCHCNNTACADCSSYSPVLGSIILVLFTLMTPLFERIILGTKLPDN
ncbi:MAG: hypothetical protein EPN39_16865 [Chitinophagaceae bacterium]|nr:MAG: hypothetical protein EPN39_16865 [Chitinophagaceae bacterium]